MLTISIVIAAILGVITGKFVYLYTHNGQVNINAGSDAKRNKVYGGIRS